MSDWIPGKEVELVQLCKKWESFFGEESELILYGLDKEECGAVNWKITDFINARSKYEADNSSVNCSAKDEAKKAMITAMRMFNNKFIRYNDKITDSVRNAIGLNVRDTTPTIRPRPVSQPNTMVENTVNRFEHRIKAMNRENGTLTKPADAYGVHFAWQVGGSAPASAEDLPKSKFSRKPSLIVNFIEADKGKQVWYAARYENSRGEAGPWSPIAEAYVW